MERGPSPSPRDSSIRKQLMQPMTWHGRSGRASGTCRSTLTLTARTRIALSPALITAPLRRSKPLRDPRVKPLPSPNLRVVSNDIQLRKWWWLQKYSSRIVNTCKWKVNGRKKKLCPFFNFLIKSHWKFLLHIEFDIDLEGSWPWIKVFWATIRSLRKIHNFYPKACHIFFFFSWKWLESSTGYLTKRLRWTLNMFWPWDKVIWAFSKPGHMITKDLFLGYHFFSLFTLFFVVTNLLHKKMFRENQVLYKLFLS